MNQTNLCEFLPWDSEFFNCRIAQIKGDSLTAESISRVLKWCEREKIDCLYFLANFDDSTTVRLAEQSGFHLVDMRVTLEQHISRAPEPEAGDGQVLIRAVRDSDIPQIRQIAGRSHTDSRFYYDAHFPREKCDELYEIWGEKSCRGFADFVLVAESDGQVGGYISGSVSPDLVGRIGLVGVRNDMQGKGIGKLLIKSALSEFAARHAARVDVGTQGRNIKAQRLYQKNGFVTKSLQLWYHLWFNRSV